ncbi:MAG: hypothetical protein B6229_07005 [Spirochaetaceae bacterium 4572_7]|nr:MAG: hypothetical protein B6229_07005 [Spirochaetaceae bacterium 4572_7]
MKEILTLQEVADYLQLSDKTILKMVKNGEIPCAKIANQWRFSKPMLDDWITSKMQVIPQNDLSRLVESQFDYIPLARLIDEKSIITDLKGQTTKEVIHELAEKAYINEFVADKNIFIKQLLEREQLTSTSIGQGIALPHLRKPNGNIVTEPKIVIGVSKEGIDFDSLDGEKTTLFLLLLSDSEVVHLKLLSKITRIFGIDNAISQIKQLRKPEEFVKFFNKIEQELSRR